MNRESLISGLGNDRESRGASEGHLQPSYDAMLLMKKELARVKEKLRESQKCLDKYNKELEDKVAERTTHLETVNEYVTELNRDLEITKAELEKKNKELRETQARLVQSEKMAAIGQLAGGVAHEINNPLAIIMAFAHEVLEMVEPEHALLMPLRTIERESTRCKVIVQNLLDFSRATEPKTEPTNINKILGETLQLLRHQFSLQNIKIIEKLNPSLPEVVTDGSQFKQVFMNLILNARQSMPNGGTLTIATRLLTNPENRGPKTIEISFSDTGCGISQENLDKIFDPFFTTKEVGKGTGLGLSVTYGLIQRHKGTIDVKSREGKGTTFIVKMPVKQ